MRSGVFRGRRRFVAAPSSSVSERGAVTAELALVLPAMAFVVAMLAWLLSLVVASGRLESAAREGARTAARGDDRAQVVMAAARVAPLAEVAITYSTDSVQVRVTERRVPLVSGLSFLTRTLSASAVAAREPE